MKVQCWLCRFVCYFCVSWGQMPFQPHDVFVHSLYEEIAVAEQSDSAKVYSRALASLRDVRSVAPFFGAPVLSVPDHLAVIYPPGHMDSSQNWGSFLVPLNIRCRNLTYNQKSPIILRTIHIQGSEDTPSTLEATSSQKQKNQFLCQSPEP